MSHVNCDAGILPVKPTDQRREQPVEYCLVTSESDFPKRRITEKLNVLYALTEVIKDGRGTVEQCATMDGRIDTLLTAIQETHAHRVFQFRDRARNRWLGRVEALRGLAHATSLGHGHEYVQILRLIRLPMRSAKSIAGPSRN